MPDPHIVAATRPREVQTAFQLLLANIACSVIGAVLSFTFVSALVEIAIKEAGIDDGLAAAVRDAAQSAGQTQIVTQVVASAVAVALTLFFVMQMRNRKNWARILLTVFGALTVLGIVIVHVRSFGDYLAIGTTGTIYAVLAIVQMLLIVAAIVFMFRPRSNAWFAHVRQAR
ncbi:hypothetical protein [Pseudonocardia sp. GCM10023141]|uniref:hypothetical protein n=1 Tax=Pseudonocardia sp. GCM10023141 TaxID=3252653 RepID=UPI00362387F0